MAARLRKLVLTVHVTASIGWFGAVAVFLALAVAGITSTATQMVCAAYLAMQVATWFVIVPLAAISLLSGIVAALGTRWGLFRYYWVLLKLLISAFATIILWVHTQPIDLLAGAVATATGLGTDFRDQQSLMVTAAVAALVALLVLTGLSVYKPQGLTRYGARKLKEERASKAL